MNLCEGVYISQDKQLISSYRSETQAKLKQVEELEDTEHARVFHVTRCSQCNGQLDLPSVHFMCNHSYHQRCVYCFPWFLWGCCVLFHTFAAVPTISVLLNKTSAAAFWTTRQRVRFAHANTVLSRRSGGTTSGFQTNTSCSFRRSARMALVL